MSPPESPDGGDRGTEDTVTCAQCGDVVDTSEWYPVHSCGTDEYEIYHFCSVACRDAWRDETSDCI